MAHGSTGASSNTTDIYERLRDEILSCVMRPGIQFRERQIADRFNVSKTPVRDALIKLQEQNLVQVIPRKGYRVTRISLADARDLYEMRVILEREAILRIIDTASDASLDELDEFRTAPVDDLEAWITYNRHMHMHLAAICGNARLARAGREVVEQFDRMTRMSVSGSIEASPLNRRSLEDRMREHGEIIDAVQARDKRRAVMLSRDHIEGSRRRLMTALESASIAL
ncbi:GntR family transcriptional regulator [Pelagibacterium montanilacus]|uniref:GntR family transcriptional regulator n=1 Tax=Pelagibacterium montanilacus TaxID=2185280 RepID=UPI0013E0B479|nr:GntR family transcriptional regulator [Pelagibacterium montanilacus]